MRGKTGKTEVFLPEFCKIEQGGSSGDTLVMWLALWQACRESINDIFDMRCLGPGQLIEFLFSNVNASVF